MWTKIIPASELWVKTKTADLACIIQISAFDAEYHIDKYKYLLFRSKKTLILGVEKDLAHHKKNSGELLNFWVCTF
jgi:hypothetical protein